MQQNIKYEAQFREKFLIAGKTGCRKTYFVQKLAANNFIWKIVKTECVLSIQLSKSREAEIQSPFSCDVFFHYPQILEAFENLVEELKLKWIDDTDASINASNGQKKKIDRLIVMVDFSGLADCLNTFENFFNGHKKIWLSLQLYVFYIILPEKEIWKKVISQTNILKIFAASVPFQTITKTLKPNFVRTIARHLPTRSFYRITL